MACLHFITIVFKDGGKEEKKKDFSGKGVKCYFIRTDSTASNDMGKPYIFSGKSIHEARMHFMHVHTLPTLAKYMARCSLFSYTNILLTQLCNQSHFSFLDASSGFL